MTALLSVGAIVTIYAAYLAYLRFFFKARRWLLPNDLSAWGLSETDVKSAFREVFDVRNYWFHGIRLDPTKKTNVVFDIGANSGFFSMFLAEHFRRSPVVNPIKVSSKGTDSAPAWPPSLDQAQSIEVFSFEPIPQTFDCLKRNVLDRYDRVFEHSGTESLATGTERLLSRSPARVDTNQSDAAATSTIHLYPVGVGSQDTSATFDCHPFFSVGATMFREELTRHTWGRGVSIKAVFTSLIEDSHRIGLSNSASLYYIMKFCTGHFLLRPLFWLAAVPLFVLYLLHIELVQAVAGYKVRRPITPLETVFKRHGITEVDFMKIDVEGAEEDVWKGLRAAGLARRVQQYTFEVHDIMGRLDRMKRELEEEGFSVWVEREDWSMHEVMRLHTLFARRNDIKF